MRGFDEDWGLLPSSLAISGVKIAKRRWKWKKFTIFEKSACKTNLCRQSANIHQFNNYLIGPNWLINLLCGVPGCSGEELTPWESFPQWEEELLWLVAGITGEVRLRRCRVFSSCSSCFSWASQELLDQLATQLATQSVDRLGVCFGMNSSVRSRFFQDEVIC